MSAMDLHPEQLFDALRAGRLSAHERARLEAHCALCSACMFELRWIDGRPLAAVQPTAQDHAYGEAAFDNLLRTTARVKDPRPLVAARKPLHWGAAGLVLGTALALLVFFGRERWSAPQSRTPASSVVPSAPNPVSPSVVEPSPPVLAITPPLASTDVVAVPQPSAATPSANALLAAARSAQTRRQLTQAQKLYRKVIDVYPSTDAAGVAYVALGRLNVELEQPQAALQLFDGYLRKHPDGTLAEEALYYRALSLDRLGHKRQAQLGLRELLTTFPSSVYVAPARARLARGQAE